MKFFDFTLILLLSSASTLALAATEPDTRAVLVGVGEYTALDADLQGPPNDVSLMADMLLAQGVAAGNIHALTDPGTQLPGDLTAVAPDRAAILAGFAQAIEASAPGDTLIFYFSGHGTQAPDDNGDEEGGFDEIFLPRDAGRWNGAIGDVENAIRDDELGALVQRATERGIRLIGIIDACHSATGFRALPDGAGRARYIDPTTLDIPEDTLAAAGSVTVPMGDYVFLYAAQSDQRAFEYPLEDGAWYGDFTRSLVNVLRDTPDLSFEQLVQAVSQRMQMRTGQVTQTPEVEGSLATETLFGGDTVQARFGLDGTRLKAGLLQDLTVGTELALFAGPEAQEPAGTAIVTALRAGEADVEFQDPYPDVRVTQATITRRALHLGFEVTISPEAQEQLERLAPGAIEALPELLDMPLTDAGTNTIVWAVGAFALVGRDGVLDAYGPGTSPRLASEDDGDNLLENMAISLNDRARLSRLEQALIQLDGQGGGGLSLLKSSPDVTVSRLSGTERGGRCRLTGEAAPITARAEAVHCDGLELTVSNGSTKMQDVTVLYVDAEAGITMLWPRPNLSNRIPSGESRSIKLGLRNTSDTALRESVLVLSVAAEPGSARTVLNALASGQARGQGGPMGDYLAQLADPASGSRSFSLTQPAGALTLDRIDLTVAPSSGNPLR
ncbi:MAG: caspase domain-containing protein [Paracoccaceae bacterium]